jgi:hypothetical protein
MADAGTIVGDAARSLRSLSAHGRWALEISAAAGDRDE